MTSRFPNNSLAMLKSHKQTLLAFQKHPYGIMASILVFFFLYWTRSAGEAVAGGALALAIFARIDSRFFLAWALIVIIIIPLFYLTDRPAQAERIGVVGFSLLALGILTSLVETWRAKR